MVRHDMALILLSRKFRPARPDKIQGRENRVKENGGRNASSRGMCSRVVFLCNRKVKGKIVCSPPADVWVIKHRKTKFRYMVRNVADTRSRIRRTQGYR
jgi:hypothetical protein